jgi:hypothetical protein
MLSSNTHSMGHVGALDHHDREALVAYLETL